MVGEWSHAGDLLATQAMEEKLVNGWKRGKNRMTEEEETEGAEEDVEMIGA